MTSLDPSTRGRRIDLPWKKPPLSMNDRDAHWAVKARKIAEVRETACWLVRAEKLGRHDRVRIELHYQPRTAHGRDSDNLAATYKPLVDGAVTDAGLAPDDTDVHVERGWPVIHPPVKGEPGSMWLVIEVLDETEVA